MVSRENELLELLESEILIGKYKPGDKLPPERQLSENYGFSRQIIHNGLIRLEEKGLIKIVSRQGAMVLDYKKYGDFKLLDTIIGFQKEDLKDDLKKSIVDFICNNQKCIISLCSKNKKFDEHGELLEIIEHLEELKNIQERKKQISNIYSILGYESGNQLFLMLMNSFKKGIENAVFYTCSDEVAYQKFKIQIQSLYHAIKGGDGERAIDINAELNGFILNKWNI